MQKKKNKRFVKNLFWIIPSILMLVIILIILMGFNKGWFLIGVPSFGDLNMIDLFGQQPSGDCKFSVDDNEVCLWNNVTGTINANSPICYIGYNYNNEGWKFAGMINEISPKFYKESRQATIIGNYIFTAICGTPMDFCRTNNVEVDVITCADEDEDGDEDADEDPITYTCGWVGEQCGGTCPSNYPSCVDVEFNNIVFADYVACVCLNEDTGEVAPDWKPDGQYHDDSGFPGGEEEPILNCIDSDGVNPFVVGTTTYLGTPHPDVCHASTSSYAVDEYVCIDDVAVKKEIYCPNSDCVDGKCMTGTTTVYQECLELGYKNGGYCSSSSTPSVGCVLMPSLDTICGDLYPLNPAKCCN